MFFFNRTERIMSDNIASLTKYSLIFVCCLALLQLGCKKFVQVNPPDTVITSATAFSSDLSAAAIVTNMYTEMSANGNGLASGNNSITCFGGMSSDEFEDYYKSEMYTQCYTNSMSSSNEYFWNELFELIYNANASLEGLSNSSAVTPQENQQLTGEAEFMRAFLDFYGTNLFGAFPIVTTTNYQTNNSISRAPQTTVYKQIIADLKDAQKLLPVNFVTPTEGITTSERVRPNKWTATALLARVYLYQASWNPASWDSAETEASQVISNSSLFSLDSNTNNVFLANSTEAIWQLQPVTSGYNTWDAYYFVLTSTSGSDYRPGAIDTSLVNTFEIGDQRLNNWVGEFTTGGQTYYYPYKYKIYKRNQPVTEYLMVLRLAEQYLIRAEAEANLGDSTDAINDLNIIRNRAGLANYNDTTNGPLLSAILHERRVELFMEWGHRWFDLQRMNWINSVMGNPGNFCQQKGGEWSPSASLFPIPLSEIELNSNLTQNTGYN